MRKVVGKTEVEDALQKLDLLTKENLTMVVARNLEDTQHFDDEATIIGESFQDVCDDVKATQEANVGVVKEATRSVDDNTKVTNRGVPHLRNFFIHILIFLSCVITVMGEYQRLLLSDVVIIYCCG